MKTYTLKGKEVETRWHVVDAAGRPLGRVATEVAHLLRGKYRPTFTPHMDNGDYVIVVNASEVQVTGNKSQQKLYRRHTGYPGGLREIPFAKLITQHPERVMQQAVKGMLPHNRLGRKLLKHLKVYGGPEHPHEAQVNAGRRRARMAESAPPSKARKAKEEAKEEPKAQAGAPEEDTAAPEAVEQAEATSGSEQTEDSA